MKDLEIGDGDESCAIRVLDQMVRDTKEAAHDISSPVKKHRMIPFSPKSFIRPLPPAGSQLSDAPNRMC